MTEQDLIIQRLRRDLDELEDELDVLKAFERFMAESFGEDYKTVCELFAKQYKGGTVDKGDANE